MQFRSCLRKKTQGRSLTWDLTRKGCDPAVDIFQQMVKMFLTGWHMPLLPKPFLLANWKAVVEKEGKKMSCDGPTAAFVATMRQIGWTGNHDLTISRPDGAPFSLLDTFPWEGAVYARRSLQTTTWREAAGKHEMYEHLEGPPFLQGVTKALKNCEPRQKTLVEGFMAGCYNGARKCHCGEESEGDQKLWWHI